MEKDIMSSVFGDTILDRKTVRISQKRQFTIPTKYFESLGFADEAECIVRGNELIIRPVKRASGGEFAEQILADLISQGYEGEALLAAFREQQIKVKKAIGAMLDEAKSVAEGKSEYSTYDDIFNSED